MMGKHSTMGNTRRWQALDEGRNTRGDGQHPTMGNTRRWATLDDWHHPEASLIIVKYRPPPKHYPSSSKRCAYREPCSSLCSIAGYRQTLRHRREALS
jgi:hypothetical protein